MTGLINFTDGYNLEYSDKFDLKNLDLRRLEAEICIFKVHEYRDKWSRPKRVFLQMANDSKRSKDVHRDRLGKINSQIPVGKCLNFTLIYNWIKILKI